VEGNPGITGRPPNVVELLLVEIELGREIVNYTSKNNVS